MAKLRIEAPPDDKPAPVHRDLVAYPELIAREGGRPVDDSGKLIAPI
jgi:hypothetical protein